MLEVDSPAHTLLAACIALNACNENPPTTPPDQPPPPARSRMATDGGADSSLAAFLGIDSLDVVSDPPSPAGNIKEELASFTTLDACVAARARFDPAVADAIDALGYDTLQHDACRVLHAAAAKDASLCNAILASSLREHCQATVAVTKADPSACPMLGPNHDPMCIAVARRDDRLCASAVLSDQPTCRAVLARDASLCGGNHRCKRKVERWSAFLPERIVRPDLGTRVSAHIAEHVDGGTLPEQTIDLTKVVRGATVRRTPIGQQIEIGELSSSTWPPAGIITSPKLLFRMLANSEMIRQGKRAVLSGAVDIDVLVPRGPLVSSETTHGPMQLDVDMIGFELGDPVRFTLEADVGPRHRKLHVRLVVNTYVSDVVTVGF